jgi:DNA-binding PadR family transcriptional regulator
MLRILDRGSHRSDPASGLAPNPDLPAMRSRPSGTDPEPSSGEGIRGRGPRPRPRRGRAGSGRRRGRLPVRRRGRRRGISRNPSPGPNAGVAERPKAADSRSALAGVPRFESWPRHRARPLPARPTDLRRVCIDRDIVEYRQRYSQIPADGRRSVVKLSPGPQAFRRRLVGLYALSLMEREGPLHGYGLSERIAQKTEGAWRPGPGSVYPSLRQLTEVGFARSQVKKRRREYTITAKGTALLRRVRSQNGPLGRPRADLSSLWAEVMGAGDVDRFLLLRLRRTLDSLEAQLGRPGVGPARAESLRAATLDELSKASSRFRLPAPRARSTRGRSRGA